MKWPSLSLILSGVLLSYITYSVYTLSLLFVLSPCVKGEVCLASFLSTEPQLELQIYTSFYSQPLGLDHVYTAEAFDYRHPYSMQVAIPIPGETRENGTLFMHILVKPPYEELPRYTYYDIKQEPTTVYTRIQLTEYAVPGIAGDEKANEHAEPSMKPVSHLRSRITLTMVTDDIELNVRDLPSELARGLRVTTRGRYLPIVKYDSLQTRRTDLVQIYPQNETMNVKISYTPISIGKLRFMAHVEAALLDLREHGFSEMDIDEIKDSIADTNVYLFGATILISLLHFVFDFLSLRSDVSFWRGKNNLVGLSVRTVVWRAFSQTVIFLYLLDKKAMRIVLIPAGIAAIVELWKSMIMLRVELVTGTAWLPRIRFKKTPCASVEEKTRKFDAESMKYLSYLLYPLIVGGAVYSLLYQPRKSWYSWVISYLVNGVYTFGFIFILPQLFVNYKLKSVAHLPWQAFVYKALNTIIDDLFAFATATPIIHRISCFRDDAVFLIYLYQRWLYPIDNSRKDDETVTINETPTEAERKIEDKKEN